MLGGADVSLTATDLSLDFALALGASNTAMLDLSAAARTVNVGTRSVVFDDSGADQRAALSGTAALEVGGLVSLSGTMGFASTAQRLVVAGEGIEARFSAGGVSAGVNNGSFGLVLNADDSFLLEASGALYLNGGGFASVSASNALLRLNTTGVAQAEQVLQAGAYAHTLSAMSALGDPVLNITGLQARLGDALALAGDFAFERDAATGELQVWAHAASASVRAGDMRAGVSDAQVALVISDDVSAGGIVLQASGAADLALGDAVQLSASAVSVQWNTTAADATGRSIVVAGMAHTFAALEAGRQAVALSDANLVVSDFFSVSGDFALLASTTTVKLAADTQGTAVDEATDGLLVDLFTLGGHNLSAQVGVAGGLGLQLSGVSFGLALMGAQADSSRRWTSLQASADSVAMTGIDGVTLSGSALRVDLNTAAHANDAVVDYSDGATSLSVPTGASSSQALDMDGAQGELLRASGELSIDLFGFFTTQGTFSFERADQELQLADGSLVQAAVLTLGATDASAFAGVGAGTASAQGLSLSGVDFALALVSDKDNTQRRWTALQASVATADFNGVDGLKLSAANVNLVINQAQEPQDAVLNTLLTPITVGVGADAQTLAIDGAEGESLRASGDFEIDAFGFVQFAGSLALEKRQAELRLDDGQQVAVDLLTLGAQDLNGFAGVNGGTAAAVGLSLTGLDLALVLANEQVDSGTARQWTSLQASAGQAALVGVEGLELAGRNLALEINRAAADGSLVDYAAQSLAVTTASAGEVSSTTLTLDAAQGELTRASGELALDAFGFLQVSGAFAIERRDGSVTLADLPGTADTDESQTAVAVSQLLVGGNGLSAFAGVGGGQANATGLVLDGVDFALALQSERLTPQQITDGATARRWTSLQAEVGEAAFVGMDGLRLSVQNLELAINRTAADGTVVDYSDGATDLVVNTGPASTLALSLDGAQGGLLQAAGFVAIDLFGFVQLEGELAFEMADASRTVRLSDGTDADVGLLVVGAPA